MSQPPPYVPATAFISYQANQSWFPGQQLDAEFNNLEAIIGDIETNLALIQNDDGTLANGCVDTPQLAPDLLLLFQAAVGDPTALATIAADVATATTAATTATTAAASLAFKVRTQSGTSYTLQASDTGYLILFTSTAAVAITAPNSFAAGSFECILEQATTTGTLTLTAQSGGSLALQSTATNTTTNQYDTLAIAVQANAGGSAAQYLVVGR